MPRTFIELPRTDDELRAGFAALRTRADVARLLAVSEKELIYILYRGGKRYIEFDIPKRSGGQRRIAAPESSIKILQHRLNQVLQNVYRPKAPVHGFTLNRGIVTNADRHLHKRQVFNLDLQDFFPSIHFGRVRGVFASPPYDLPFDVAQVLAQLCTHNGALPQGAPTSPVVSNMVCVSLDSSLRRLAEQHACTYTRYADDLTFSTTRRLFPTELVAITESAAGKRTVGVGSTLRDIIEKNSFQINVKKVRLRSISQRQEVTGLIVGQGVNVPREYIRGVRGMLHAWHKYGYANAEAALQARHYRKHRRPGAPPVELLAVASGKLEFLRMVRGASDLLYTKLWNRFAALAGPPYTPRIALVNTAQQIDSTLWLLESVDPEDPDGIVTGTAFALDGHGLVTCSHCLGNEPIFAHQPGLLSKPQRVTITHALSVSTLLV